MLSLKDFLPQPPAPNFQEITLALLPLSEALDMIFSAAQHSNAAITEMVSSQPSWWGRGRSRHPQGPCTSSLQLSASPQPPRSLSAHPLIPPHDTWPDAVLPLPSRRCLHKANLEAGGPCPALAEGAPPSQERLQDLWEVYQRLGLEDDIVDPSNTLLREGPVLKISFRRSDPMERYLFLVRGCWGPNPHGEGSPWATLPQVLPACCPPGACPYLIGHPGDLGQVTCVISQTHPRKQQSQILNLGRLAPNSELLICALGNV